MLNDGFSHTCICNASLPTRDNPVRDPDRHGLMIHRLRRPARRTTSVAEWLTQAPGAATNPSTSRRTGDWAIGNVEFLSLTSRPGADDLRDRRLCRSRSPRSRFSSESTLGVPFEAISYPLARRRILCGRRYDGPFKNARYRPGSLLAKSVSRVHLYSTPRGNCFDGPILRFSAGAARPCPQRAPGRSMVLNTSFDVNSNSHKHSAGCA